MLYGIRLGYVCINTHLRKENIFTSRSLILSTVASKGLDYVRELAKNNVEDLLKILIYNEAHGIRFFRISSCVFPHLGNPKIGEGYNIDFIKPRLKEVGAYAKAHGHRLTAHPSQFCQLATPREDVLQQSIVDLTNHVALLKAMGYTPVDGSVLIIHGGGTFGDKIQSLSRWKENFLRLPKEVQQYIALENDEYNYGIMDLLPVCEELNIPFCMDIFHNSISKDRVPITKKLVRRIFATWNKRNIVPKIHVSEQQLGLRKGSHSKTLNRLPLYLFKLPYLFKTNFDIMLEVKDKEVSVFKMYYKYFDIHMDATGRVNYRVKNKVLDKIGIDKSMQAV